MSEMTSYVIGFLFDGDKMVMVRKNRPAWQRGLLNAVGGHIEDGETPHCAMVREFREETGAEVTDWRHFATMFGSAFEVYCFFTEGDSSKCHTTTDEEIVIADKFIKEGCIDNIPWLVEMSESFKKLNYPVDHFRIEYIRPDGY